MSLDASQYRNVIGCFATGVTVITTNVGGRLHGFTANAVTSVSLDPLMLLVCVGKESNAHAELSGCKNFGVNILAADQQELSNLFAKSGEPTAGSLRGAEFDLGDRDVPLLRGTVAHLVCEHPETLAGGDHTIFLARVVSGESTSEAPPLIYYRSRYRDLDPSET